MRRITLALLIAALFVACSSGSSSAAIRRKTVPVPATWRLTVYYTPVASMHSGPTARVTGCPVLECEFGSADLGTYPVSFRDAVEQEGNGKIDVGPNKGRYLNWSYDVGFWLDSVPRDSHGKALLPFVSAAADKRVLPKGATFSITACGRPVEPEVCAKVRASKWEVRDEFTPGLGGARHVDLYIGEQTSPTFEDDSPFYFASKGARLTRLK